MRNDALQTPLWPAFKAAARRLGLRRFWRRRPPPGNLQARDASPEALAGDVAYGFATGRNYLNWMKKLGIEARGAQVLEVGPGVAFGAMAYVAAHGAKVRVADRWLAPWQDSYHGKYYAALAARIEEENDGGDAQLVRRLAEANGYERGPISLVVEPAEVLDSLADETFDIVFSNAVLEHLADPPQAFVELRRITKTGGYGVHQLDFRDHRNFDDPLAHLLLAPGTFLRQTKQVHYAYGSQLRREDYAALFAQAGFSIIEYESNKRASDSYLDNFMPRLERAVRSPYRSHTRRSLADLGGVFFVRRVACAG